MAVQMGKSIDQKLEMIVNDVLDMDPKSAEFNPGELEYRSTQFRIGSQFVRDRNMNERIKVGQMIRVIGMIATTPEAREEYVRKTAPGMIADLLSRPK